MNLVPTCKCGNPIPVNWGGKKKWCSEQCREKYRTRNLQRPFIALDGEGIQNRYVLLAASNGATIQGENLGTIECLDFLLNLPSSKNGHTRPIYVWFAFDYDVNMILGDIDLGKRTGINQRTDEESEPERTPNYHGTIGELRRENTVAWGDYRITYFKRKIFRVTRNGSTFTSYDLWSFFGSSFENALREWGIEIPPIITEGKAARGSFEEWKPEKLKIYNQAELELLVQLAEALRNSTLPLELSVRSWHGPGSLAGSWLGKNRVKRYMRGEIPKDLNEIATRAYFGGRIDATGYGFCNPVYHYDIISAYPAAIANLPNLTKLQWNHLRKPKDLEEVNAGRFVARIHWEIPTQSWGVFPWRSKNGTIRYPLEGEGWYWDSEILAAIEKGLGKYIELKELWFSTGYLERPLYKLIHETFAYRKELKKSGNPAHHSTKLILNSLYGKFAQTVGKAQFYNPIWAGLITSHTRAKLLEQIDENTLCVMTDSIWSSSSLVKGSLIAGGELGEWEQQEETSLALAEAGLYSAISSEGRNIWQRGFDKDTPVDIEGLVSKWLTDDPTYSPEYKVHRFVGMGLASVTKHPWRYWVNIDRVIHPVPLTGTTKRLPLYPLEYELEQSQFVKLQLRPRDEQELSYPYIKETLDDELVMRELEDEISE